MLHPDLALCMKDFFTQFTEGLPDQPGGGKPDVATLVPVFAGEYRRNGGTTPATERCYSVTRTPEFVIAAQTTQVTVSGTGAGRTFAVSGTDVGSSPRLQTIVLLKERADITADDAATMTRIFADHPQGAQWATALAGLTDKAALAVQLSTMTQVPTGLPTTDLDEFKAFLEHYFTYKADGTYYAKYATPPPAGQFPTHMTPDYLQENFLEQRLQQGRMYIYAVLPLSVWQGSSAPAGMFRECVFRLDDQGQSETPRYRMSLISTVALYLDPAQQATAASPREQIICFHSQEGLGLSIADSGRDAASPSLAGLLEWLTTVPAHIAQAIADVRLPVTGTEQAPEVLLLGNVAADFPQTPLPQGVEVGGEGSVRTFKSPVDKVIALAERPDVTDLQPAVTNGYGMDCAHASLRTIIPPTPPAVAATGYYANLGIPPAQGGRGVLVGIIDTGVDATHPAFQRTLADGSTQSRVFAAWDQVDTSDNTRSPLGRRSAAALPVQMAYAGMSYGFEQERSVATDNVVRNWDPPGPHPAGHGTHVAGIAAGNAFTAPAATPWPGGGGNTWPGGIAQDADLIVVRSTLQDSHVLDAIRYCFQKATEAGLPCVINFSAGGHANAHDGTDLQSQGVTALVTDPASGDWRPGRIFVSIAHNQQDQDIHSMFEVAPGATVNVRFRPNFNLPMEMATFWAYARDSGTVNLEVSVRSGSASAGTLLTTAAVGPQPTHAIQGFPGGGGGIHFGAARLALGITNGPVRPANRHRNIDVMFMPDTPGGGPGVGPTPAEWTIRFVNRGRSLVFVDGWGALIDSSGSFVGATLDQTRKITSPASSPGSISVASYISRNAAGACVPAATGGISSFSNHGPLRGTRGRQGIDFAAPGENIFSADTGTADLTAKRGTSMAAPMVTGVIACLLARHPNLTMAQARERLQAACDPPNNQPNVFGAGKLNTNRINVL